MVDTLSLWLSTDEGNRALNALSEVQEHAKKQTGDVYHTGRLDGLRVSVFGHGVKIEGSLPKYLTGQNVKSVSLNDIRSAVDTVGESLGLPIRDSIIRRIDIGETFPVSRIVPEYLNRFGDLLRCKRYEYADRSSLLYKNSNRELIFYDKAAEVRKSNSGASIPKEWIKNNLLRFEKRYRKTGEKVAALWNSTFVWRLIDEWQDD